MSVAVETLERFFKVYSVEKCADTCFTLEGREVNECIETCLSATAK